ncbi:McrB family protein [Bacillus testis]|uniref:McrB family protein n=1 Tax=Bacillus testis TaxID=1622072 RepID=UPI00067EEE3B|nr:AAA family ATPase [Bacillus testis]
MLKQVRSWSKPEGQKNIIARKKIDYSMFMNGSHIPQEFHEDFAEANSEDVTPGDKKPVKLLINGESYEASLTNITRKNEQYKPALQLRYDQNTELKEKMRKWYKVSYDYIMEHKQSDSKAPVITPPEIEEFMEFYKTDKPYVYEVNILNKKINKPIQFWWVNQGKTHQQEKEGGYLWAPQQSKQGRPLSHHIDLKKANVGDVVFCYSDSAIRAIGIVKKKAIESAKPSEIANHDWQEQGYLVELEYHVLDPILQKNDIPIEWRIEETGPFDVNGNVKQGYFFTVSESFVNLLFPRFQERFPEKIRHLLLSYLKEWTADYVKEVPSMNDNELVKHIHSYITGKGFLYSQEEVTNLFLSLKSKPFVILSGISGTGKTKMVQWFAESLGANEQNGQFALIPVRPDWNDGSDLLGYVDIKGDFKEGPLTKVIRKAAADPENPYFVLLDEMNLARVEHYFSDILSVMESRKWEDGQLVTSVLLSKEITGDEDVRLPANVYVIGTVNMDETTHPFSKKVLDRANTIEFNRVELSNLSFLNELGEVSASPIKNDQLVSKYLHLKDVYGTYPELVSDATGLLEQINEVLRIANAHVGYRVRDEICFYLAYNQAGKLLDQEVALDHCILQKILPRISGSDSRTKMVLEGLYRLFTNREWMDNLDQPDEDVQSARFPLSAGKVVEMLRRFLDDGFTSFWIA